MKNNSKSWFFAGLAGLVLVVPQANGQTVVWGGSVSSNPLSFDSKGNQDINTLVWELGWFNDGYTPDATNFTTWALNWNSVDTGSFLFYPGAPGDPDLYSSLTDIDNPGSASVGKQMYTFVHNGGTTDTSVWGPLMGTPDGEALLYTAGLAFLPIPAPTVSFNIANNPLDAADDNTFQVIWGRVDRNMYQDALWGGANTPASPAPPNGGVITGGGIISSLIADSQATPYDLLNGTFENQTATWAPIPEPSAAFLGAIGAVLLLRRRR